MEIRGDLNEVELDQFRKIVPLLGEKAFAVRVSRSDSDYVVEMFSYDGSRRSIIYLEELSFARLLSEAGS